MTIVRHFDRYFKNKIDHFGIHVDSIIKTSHLHIFHLVAKMWTRQHRQYWGRWHWHWYLMKGPLGFKWKQTINQSYVWFDAQLPNDHLYKSSLHLSREASVSDATNVSVLTIELWQVIIYCTCASQLVPFIIYMYIIKMLSCPFRKMAESVVNGEDVYFI